MLSEEYITITELCYMLGVSETTVRNWYKWYKIRKVECPELPMPEKFHGRNFWKRSDIGKILAFKEWIPHGRNGVMRDVNYKYWGKKNGQSK